MRPRARSAPPPDPTRLLRSATPAARLLQLYARRTVPGPGATAVAWHRLRPAVSPAPQGPPDGTAVLPKRWLDAGSGGLRAWVLGGVLSAALSLLLLTKVVALPPAASGAGALPTGAFQRSPNGQSPNGQPPEGQSPSARGAGGATGAIEHGDRGAGGMEGASGAHGSGGAA
jgi:hypothetical protein